MLNEPSKNLILITIVFLILFLILINLQIFFEAFNSPQIMLILIAIYNIILGPIFWFGYWWIKSIKYPGKKLIPLSKIDWFIRLIISSTFLATSGVTIILFFINYKLEYLGFSPVFISFGVLVMWIIIAFLTADKLLSKRKMPILDKIKEWIKRVKTPIKENKND